MAIDSHMHVNSIISENVQKYIDETNENDKIENVVNVGLNLATSKESILISKGNPKSYSTIGIHPLYIDLQDTDFLYNLADNDKVVAIGEIGLDSLKNNFDEQKNYLIKQIIIANELHLPVIIQIS